MEAPNAGPGLVFFNLFFIVFIEVFTRLLDPQFVDINVMIDERKTTFSVPGIINVETEGFKDPVSVRHQVP